MAEDFKAAYKTIMDDSFPERMEIRFGDGGEIQTLVYEKVSWVVEGVRKGLRYGENPGQEAALYRPINGNLVLGGVKSIAPGRGLVSEAELLQSGKHSAVIVKHNNPCGAASAETLREAYERAYFADRVAAFGGAVALNRPLDAETAEAVVSRYCEVVAAPEFEEGALAVLSRRKNLRVMRIERMGDLERWALERTVDFKSLMDGGIIAQWSYLPVARSIADFKPAEAERGGKTYRMEREPTTDEALDLLFGWLVEAGITSNSVIYVKDRVTVGIGTGEQDRVGVAEIARDKAYRKLQDRLCFEKHGVPFNACEDAAAKAGIVEEVRELRGGLRGARMVSDAFFPFRDGVDVGIREGVTAVVQPGGSERDFESIQACNEAGVAMVFTGQRSFKH
ncbi:MAG: IMP cyclohydrolase [Planctomycetota bacterium]|jgi:phosphoribosylaminoimidazolecarboxamide formyltransferase/IMP cyclohydrolase